MLDRGGVKDDAGYQNACDQANDRKDPDGLSEAGRDHCAIIRSDLLPGHRMYTGKLVDLGDNVPRRGAALQLDKTIADAPHSADRLGHVEWNEQEEVAGSVRLRRGSDDPKLVTEEGQRIADVKAGDPGKASIEYDL